MRARRLAATAVVCVLGIGAAACSETSSDSGAVVDVSELGPEVAKLRVEVERLREEVRRLEEQLAATASTTTTTTVLR